MLLLVKFKNDRNLNEKCCNVLKPLDTCKCTNWDIFEQVRGGSHIDVGVEF